MVLWRQPTCSGDLDPADLRGVCREVVAAIAEHHAELRGGGVDPNFTPDDVRALLADELHGEGASAGLLLSDWRARVASRLTAIDGLREHCSKSLGLARYLHNLVGEHPDFEVLQEPTPLLYCFRYVPNKLAERQEESEVRARLDRLNREIAEAVGNSGPALLMTTRIRKRVALRISISSHRTLEADVDATFEATARWGRSLTASLSLYEQPLEMEAS